jgi:type II secretory pathway pseudopilin PulG
MPTDRANVPTRPVPRDGGFSVAEIIISLAVIGTVMTAMVPFVVGAVVTTVSQRTGQAAIEVAGDALERARAVEPTALLAGRSKLRTEEQRAAAPQAVLDLLDTTQEVWDPILADTSTAGDRAPLPTASHEVTVGGTKFQQNWYVGRCYQEKATASQPLDCTATPAAVPYLRVVVSVTWTQARCDERSCIYVASTLVSAGSDPTFDLKRPPPVVTSTANQVGYVGVAVTYPLAASGGWLPRTWSATGLPPGLTLTPSTGVIAGTPTTAGPNTVTVIVKDKDNKTDDATFTWTIFVLPALTAPGDQTSQVGVPVTMTVARTGGRAPLTWAATGLPAGLSIDTSTGAITGNPTTPQTTMAPVTVTVTDAGGKAASVTFGWRVLTVVQMSGLNDPWNMTDETNISTVTPSASGGLAPYTWQALNLPDGLSINPSNGAITGTVRSGTRYLTTVTVTDSAGGTASQTVVCNVTPASGGDLRVTTPVPATADRTTTLGTPVSFAVAAAPGAGSHTWSAAGLPPGLTITPGGAISGTPNTRGTYVTKLTVLKPGNETAYLMFTWRVT